MRTPLSPQLLKQAERFQLRSACGHCLYWVEREQRCLHDWPTGDQRRWPLDAPDQNGRSATEVLFCKEFELR